MTRIAVSALWPSVLQIAAVQVEAERDDVISESATGSGWPLWADLTLWADSARWPRLSRWPWWACWPHGASSAWAGWPLRACWPCGTRGPSLTRWPAWASCLRERDTVAADLPREALAILGDRAHRARSEDGPPLSRPPTRVDAQARAFQVVESRLADADGASKPSARVAPGCRHSHHYRREQHGDEHSVPLHPILLVDG